MNEKIKNVCVFASSCNTINQKYFNAAYSLGRELAYSNYDIVFGGSDLGLMGEVTKAASNFGSEIIGVMPEKLYNLGIKEGCCTKFILTKGMRERKAKMDELSQALIALPGGFGTLEELSEMIVQKQLGYNNKPVVILNIDGYYDSLALFFEKIISEKFAPLKTGEIFYIAKTPKEAVEYINNYEFSENNYLDIKISMK